jgi:hypothetical protein
MQSRPSQRFLSIPAERTRSGSRLLKRASLLVGTALLVDAAPAWAVGECGPPPPPGQPVVCPAGEYPDGVTIFTTSNNEVRLEPGFISRDTSGIFGILSQRVVGPVNTLFDVRDPQGGRGLIVSAQGPTFVHIDDVSVTGTVVQPAGGVTVTGSSSAVLIADNVVARGISGVHVIELFPPPFFPPLPTPTGAEARVNSVTTTGDSAPGVIASSQQSGSFVESGTVATSGAGSPGITSIGSFSTIRSGTVTTAGANSAGIIAAVTPGQVDIVSANIVTQGTNSPGIRASSGAGVVIVSVGNVSVAGSGSNAIDVDTPAASRMSIGGLVQSAQGLAVRASGGPATVNILGGGTLRGRIELAAGADRVNNAGTFDAIGSSAFGAGADLFDNGPGGIVRAVNGAASFAGLESFANSGLIDLADGATGDSLALGGAYAGTGGARLRVDVDFAANSADRLTTGAATGSTRVEVQSVGGFGSGILIVDAAAGTSPTAFALAPGSDSPYLRAQLRFDAANNDFLLDQLPRTPVFETARFAGMATNLWYESADAVAAQLDTMRDGRGGRGIGLWLQGWTGETESDGLQSFGGETFDVSFNQDFQGLQGGLDFQTGSVAIGITAGAGRSDADFKATGDPVDMKVRNIGAYLQGRSGPAFFNALAKFDWAELEIAPGAGLGASFDSDQFGIQANAGVRLGSGGVFAEPSLGLSWVRSDVEAFDSGPAAVGPGRGESLRARAGLRVGTSLPLGGGTLLPFVAANAYEELDGENSSDFTLGETLRLVDERPGTRGRAAAGVSFAAGRFEAFVRGEMDFHGGSDSKSVRAGARLRF